MSAIRTSALAVGSPVGSIELVIVGKRVKRCAKVPMILRYRYIRVIDFLGIFLVLLGYIVQQIHRVTVNRCLPDHTMCLITGYSGLARREQHQTCMNIVANSVLFKSQTAVWYLCFLECS